MAVFDRKGSSAASGSTEVSASIGSRETLPVDAISARDSAGKAFPTARLDRRQVATALLFGLVSLALLLAGLGNPTRMYFD